MIDPSDRSFYLSMGCGLAVGAAVGYAVGRHVYKRLISEIGPIDPMSHPSCQLAVDARQLFMKGKEGTVKWGTDWEEFKILLTEGKPTTPTLARLHKQLTDMPQKGWALWAVELTKSPVTEIRAEVERVLRIPIKTNCIQTAGLAGTYAGMPAMWLTSMAMVFYTSHRHTSNRSIRLI